MTNVTYEIRKNGYKGCLKATTLDEAKAKAKQIGGTYKAVYSEVPPKPLTERDIELRVKRLAHFGIAY